MAVYEQGYRLYAGPRTERRFRFLVPARYAASDVFASKLVTAAFALSLVAPLAAMVVVYLHHNLSALAILGLPAEELTRLIPIDARFFYYFSRVQGFAAFFLTALIAPGLISPDLAHNALPLYLCRPFTRGEYVLGKMTLLVGLLSLVTWLPGLLLVGFQTALEGLPWLGEHARLVPAILIGGVVWVLVLSLLGLALSAWVRWRTVAAGLLFAVVFVSPAFALAVDSRFDTYWGGLVDLRNLIAVVWERLFYGAGPANNVPVWAAWLALAVLAGFCLLLLDRKIRAYEVIK